MKSLILSGILTGLLLPGLSVGQTTAEVATPATASPTPPTTWLPNTLFKLGMGLSRRSGYGGFSGLQLPLTVGVEHQFNRKISVYGNVSPLLQAGGRYYDQSNVPWLRLTNFIVDVGARYYYNQAKREQRGRAHGLFVGNYLALQANNDWYSYKLYDVMDTRRHYRYGSSGLGAFWGMQRRIGKWGLFDGNAGLGINNDNYMYVFDYKAGRGYAKRRLGLLLEINVRIGLAH